MKPKISFLRKKGLNFNYIDYKKLKRNAAYIINLIFENESVNFSEINIYFCDNAEIRQLNKKYLQHDNNTDILTFEYGESAESDIIISVEQIGINAELYNIYIIEELYRVIVHGILHLCGYKDKTKNEKNIIKLKENFYLEKIVNHTWN